MALENAFRASINTGVVSRKVEEFEEAGKVWAIKRAEQTCPCVQLPQLLLKEFCILRCCLLCTSWGRLLLMWCW